MKDKITKQNKLKEESQIHDFMNSLSADPQQADVSASFSELMETVTSDSFVRIPSDAVEKDVSALHPKSIMTKLTKICLIATPALAVVVMMVYVAFPSDDLTQYDDIITQALPQEDYLEEPLVDSYNDLYIEETREMEDLVTTSSNAQDAEEKTEVEEVLVVQKIVDIESDLSFDKLFGNDDIDDTELNAWFTDDFVDDALFETYDI